MNDFLVTGVVVVPGEMHDAIELFGIMGFFEYIPWWVQNVYDGDHFLYGFGANQTLYLTEYAEQPACIIYSKRGYVLVSNVVQWLCDTGHTYNVSATKDEDIYLIHVPRVLSTKLLIIPSSLDRLS